MVAAVTRRKWRYPDSGLYKVDHVGLDDIVGLVVAFGDFNSDKSTDIFVLSPTQTALDIYVWNTAPAGFSKLESTHIDFTQTTLSEDPPIIVTAVVPGDFNYDGQLDVLIMGRVDPDGDPDGHLYMKVYLGDGQNGFEATPVILPPAAQAQPIPLDLTGDMTTDLLGISAADGTLKVWKNTSRSKAAVPLFELHDVPTMDGAHTMCQPSSPHASAWVDLNGDCRADLFITCAETKSGAPQFQIWLGTHNQGLAFAREGTLPVGTGQISFADMDGDGTLDMVFAACADSDGSECAIHLVYNQQMPLCPQSKREPCRSMDQLCQADDSFQLDPSLSPTSGAHVVVPVHDLLPEESVVLADTNFRGQHPLRLQLGDINYDGFADVMLTTKTSQGQYALRLLQSVPCESGTCDASALATGRRTFAVIKDGVGALKPVPGLQIGTFFDLDDDGTLDVIRLTAATDTSHQWSTQVLFNNFFSDAFFAKTLMLNGVCLKWCTPGLDDGSIRAKPYGVNYPGASIKYSIVDTVGQKRVFQLAQLGQSNYMARQTPYNLFGLGRTNNYIEELFVGSTYNQTTAYRSWQGIIPNSQLMISPYQGDGTDTDSWNIELYINPSSSALGVLVVLLITIAVLAVTVLVFNWFEKRQDKREKDRALHVINFDAL
ncbi:hypothetical protein H4R34_004150 [Dimargaris verticillata]|uniref:T-cell immunomodulatory protein TIP C2 domain-containing protein n=1 Tax=Dimargaris verticillata TaxID=2761393 RepID=A0A9W8B358_9FUNG|nr:hypothetical protein H4R34_004150 [Dimargaris verticillata]